MKRAFFSRIMTQPPSDNPQPNPKHAKPIQTRSSASKNYEGKLASGPKSQGEEEAYLS
jgi:hypothetical protein